jgi:hypothetical protein
VSSAENTHRSHSQVTKQPQWSIYLAGKIQLGDQFFFSCRGRYFFKKVSEKGSAPSISIAQSRNLATLQRNNDATLHATTEQSRNNATLKHNNHATITQPCNATITQPCNAYVSITQLCNATLQRNNHATLLHKNQNCNVVVDLLDPE